jgi:hypothetical protein
MIFLGLVFEGTFTSFFKDKKSKKVTKTEGTKVFLLLLLDDRRIRIRSRIDTSDQWIRIRVREAQKHVDPVDPEH